uniref:hypothetical protein n=1 Tax=Candidatus Electronema sp. TaxID=2698783 RepID=UPI0040576964
MKLPKQQAGVSSVSRNIEDQQTASILPSGTCGSGRFENWIRDSYGGANFTEACRNHDKCYDTCGKNKEHCDDVFKSEMHDACNRTYSSRWHVVQRRLCKETANTYHSAVNRMGGDAYRAAQRKNGCA